MSWDRLEVARRLSSEPSGSIVRLLVDSETGIAPLAAGETGRIGRLVDEAAARLENGGTLRIAAAGAVAHLVRFVADEASAWFDGALPIELLTAGEDAGEEDAVARVEANVHPEDVVLAVSRSGNRPWTCTFVRKANMIGALTGSISCMPDSPLARESDMPIVVSSGAEVVMGAVQYRAAMVVKVVLDVVLLALAARRGGLWGDVPVRHAAGAEAWRLVAAAAGVDHLRARSLVARAGGDVGVAIVMGKLDVGEVEARQRLSAADGVLEHVIGRA